MNQAYKKHLTEVRKEVKQHLKEIGQSVYGMKVQIAYELYGQSKGFKVPSDKRKAEDYLIYRKFGYFVNRNFKDEKSTKRVKAPANTFRPLSFYSTDEWHEVRDLVNNFYDARCMKCGVIKTVFHVDHILPRSLYPEYELHPDNLQRLCKNCNETKSNKECIDYRNQIARRRFMDRLHCSGMNLDFIQFEAIIKK